MKTFLSVCSGIEAASVALNPLGWEAVGFFEIEPFPCAVLAHHYPHVPNFGDLTKHHDSLPGTLRFDVLLGGTPCQGFSLAGLRGGLDDPRSQLLFHFVEIAARHRPRWLVWENVPGVLSSDGGRDFAAFLGALTGRDIPVPEGGWSNSGHVAGISSAYGIAWRVLDAQHFGVPQRRRRVFVVGYLGDWTRAAAVLFERHSLSGNPPPRREAGQGVAGTLTKSSLDGSSPCGGDGREGMLISEGFETGPLGGGFTDLAPTLDTRCKDGPIRNQLGLGVMETVATVDASFGRLQGCSGQDLNHGHSHLVPDVAPSVTSKWAKGSGGPSGGPSGDECQNFLAVSLAIATPLVAHTLRGEGFDASEDGTGRGVPLVPVAFDTTQITSADNRSNPQPGDPCHPLAAGAHPPCIAFDSKASGQNGFGVGFALRASASHSGDKGDGGMNTTTVLEDGPEMAVRRLTPCECENLQGFPDDYTRIPGWNGWRAVDEDEDIKELRALGLTVKISPRTGIARVNDPDGPRYKALGNSWAVPCARWIGERIDLVDAQTF